MTRLFFEIASPLSKVISDIKYVVLIVKVYLRCKMGTGMLKMCPNSKGVVVSFFFFHSFQYALSQKLMVN